MAAHGATQLPTGSIPTGLPIGEEVKEYEKILRISDDVFSGIHPRLKVPRQFVRKATSRNPPNPPITTQTQVAKAGGPPVSPPEGTEKSSQSILPASEVTSSQTTPMNGPSAAATAMGPSSRIVPKPASEIDPIFLTKSDDLVRAEIQLERQRVERTLREQLDQKRQESRQKTSIQDTKPDFDVSDVLNKALDMVRPTAPSDIAGPNGTGAPSDSFDENSFYSSRAPDSPQNGEPQRTSLAPPSNPDDLATEAPVEHNSDELQRLEALNRTGPDQEMQDTYNPVADQRLPYHQRQPHNAQVDLATPRSYEAQPPTDALEEPEYSPPAPGVPPMERRDSQEFTRGYPGGTRQRRAPDGRQADRIRYTRRSASPGGDMRIVRNHITSPAAPQPSRVSPLAITKVPSVHQLKESRPEYGSDRGNPGQDSDRATPDVAAPHLMPRKRRRLQEGRDKPRQVSYRRQAFDSDPYIKEEPVSPPPFADTPAFRSRQPQERPIYIDIASPQYTPAVERREPSIRDPAYELDPYREIHTEPGIQRTVSRLSTRRPARDDQDLRRVASLHNARQPEYPREYIDQTSPRALRAPSYAVVERPLPEQPRYYDKPAQPYSRRYVPIDESPTSTRYREVYYDEEPPTRIMAPPPRRIVVDAQGNQYYETMATPRMQPMAPPVSRIPKGDVYEDHPPVRPASVRAASIIEDPYGGRRYVQEMPPPQSTYRRVTDYARPTPAERRPYTALDEREPYPRSSSVQVTEYPPRHAAYVDEADIPRERLVRMSSVRPPTATRYDEPREVIQRVESVRPGGRDMSVYVDEDPRRARDYIERPVYMAARAPAREERYYDGGEPERMLLEGGRDVVHRAPPRY
ncbi:hypothetical protein ASPWEDRAFT_45443 [Aspergillus wentii DTO 134E9]|uniref:Uncharacterized protein n=1 Tax=Aspergillus wentii DTO 134E9 TaxID=1073089 RepID=A0A1L9R9A0_ASPWE|nr:uncharacterized protein ASPWEDRAFT_45443 [Aspergillus wentii DTO 134E9]KAI9926457.1 hypothetical protein MW887_004222 [Aspergillus wentii]OJJ31505.1 hypothetical protein ASPWEDRAFT_45443 [Aspergillus wentii DTO 134E9]